MGDGKILGADRFTEVMDLALRDVEGDERTARMARVAGFSIRLELSDLGVAVRIATSDDVSRNLTWSFDDEGPAPRLDLVMDEKTADAYLRGEESLAVAIVRGRAKMRADAGSAIVCLPAMKLLVEPYRRWTQKLGSQAAAAA